MTQTDLKGNTSDPAAVEVLRPPPYDPVQSGSTAPTTATPLYSRPRNHILISRTFGAIPHTRFAVDPNIRLPSSLLQPKRLIAFHRPTPNLELDVEFGAIDAEVDVLPLSEDSPQNGDPDADGIEITESGFVNTRKKVRVKARTATGNITLRVHAPPTAPIALSVSSSFGRIRVYLPRTLHGPLSISSLRAHRLSPELQRACTPLSEVGNTTRWFVGDIAAWSAKGERGDEVCLESEFATVWVGYVGEEEVGEGAEKESAPGWGKRGVDLSGALVLLGMLYWILMRFAFSWEGMI
ncbi:hypothetical protein B0H10DRAFT_2049783 [Mycena sp. CBHHK59/15]|nr:hypothetical protein B0H10DRAFT_2049783 [Mycena sp. CBHHK59/15]